MSVSATARFTVTIDIPIGSWNEAETFKSLREVVVREGTAKLRQALVDIDYKVIGAPKLISMMAKED